MEKNIESILKSIDKTIKDHAELHREYIGQIEGHSGLYAIEKLVQRVIQEKNPEIVEYVIEKLYTESLETYDTLGNEYLENAVELAEKTGNPQKVRDLTEKILERQMRCAKKYPFVAADTCIKLGEFDQAIDIYKQSENPSIYADTLLNITLENKPERITEIAQFILDHPNSNRLDAIVRAAGFIGNNEKAKKILKEYAQNFKEEIRSAPFYYREDFSPLPNKPLVLALLNLDMKSSADFVVESLMKYDEKQKARDHLNYPKEVDNLIALLGDSPLKKKPLYLKREINKMKARKDYASAKELEKTLISQYTIFSWYLGKVSDFYLELHKQGGRLSKKISEGIEDLLSRYDGYKGGND